MRDVADRPFLGEQLGAGLGRIARGADHRHDLVEVRHGDHQAQQEVRPLARLVQFELGAAGDDLLAEGDEALHDIAQGQRFGPAAADRQHVGREARLRRRVAPDLVEHHFGRRIALKVDHHAHAFARGFVADVADALDALFLGGVGDLFDQARLADLIGDRGENDALTPLALGAAGALDLVPTAHQDRPAPGGVGLPCAVGAEDQRSGGEIGAGDELDELIGGDRRVLDEGKAAVDHFAQIVRGHVGCHADRDPACAVDQQVGEARGQHGWFAPAAVVVFGEVDRVLVEIVEQAVRHPCQTRFGIAHRGRRIGVHRAEIALTVDQRHAHRPVLRHARKGIVDRAVAVGVVVTHHVADDLGALAIGPPGDKAAFLAGEENAAVDRLQPVTHIG